MGFYLHLVEMAQFCSVGKVLGGFCRFQALEGGIDAVVCSGGLTVAPEQNTRSMGVKTAIFSQIVKGR